MTASLRALTTILDGSVLGDTPLTTAAELVRAGLEPHVWLRRGDGLLGFGELTSFNGTGPERFADAEQWWRELLAGATVTDTVKMPGTGALAFGSFAFSKTSTHPSVLIVPELVIGSRDGLLWVTLLTLDGTVPTPAAAHARVRELLLLAAETTPAAAMPAGTVQDGALSPEQWKASVADGVRAIADSGLEKVVLARDVVARFAAPVARISILQQLLANYSECWTYGVRGLVGATPEMLIQVEGATARARVLAGTLDREDEPANAVGFAATVLAGSAKQRQEHDFAVRSLSRQLAPFATDLSVPVEPFILELPNVWHLASDVSAELADTDGHLPSSLALVAALHPTAAVCGTPRERAGQLILALEHLDRGPYAGPVGWLDGAGNGEWGIALRGAVLEDPQTVRLYAGAGIVAASDPDAELAETWAKLRPMLQALGLHRP